MHRCALCCSASILQSHHCGAPSRASPLPLAPPLLTARSSRSGRRVCLSLAPRCPIAPLKPSIPDLPPRTTRDNDVTHARRPRPQLQQQRQTSSSSCSSCPQSRKTVAPSQRRSCTRQHTPHVLSECVGTRRCASTCSLVFVPFVLVCCRHEVTCVCCLCTSLGPLTCLGCHLGT